MPREVVIPSNHPRVDAIKYVTDHGKHTLVVQNFLNAAKPGGQDAMQIDLDGMPVDFEMIIHGIEDEDYEIAKAGIQGYVKETGQAFIVRDDYDFANQSKTGKGHHVNVSLGHEPPRAYYDAIDGYLGYLYRVQTTGERCVYVGEAEAAKWYVNWGNPYTVKVVYESKNLDGVGRE